MTYINKHTLSRFKHRDYWVINVFTKNYTIYIIKWYIRNEYVLHITFRHVEVIFSEAYPAENRNLIKLKILEYLLYDEEHSHQ